MATNESLIGAGNFYRGQGISGLEVAAQDETQRGIANNQIKATAKQEKQSLGVESGALAGATVGGMVAGPYGAAAGALVGSVAGLFGTKLF